MTKQERLEKEQRRFAEMTEMENELHQQGIRTIAGIDEVGRGPLAGPVYTACVVLPDDFDVLGIDDSKKVTEKRRIKLDVEIREKALAIGIGIATNQEIDEMNILNATKLAMKRAIEDAQSQLPEDRKIDMLLIDAVQLDEVDIPQKSIIKGDATCLSIGAASIIAKVARDNFMIEMDETYPGYAFASNKGYGTAAHYDGIRELGVTPIHRMTFLKNFKTEHANPAAGNKKSVRPEVQFMLSAEEEKKLMAAKKVYAVRKGRNPGLYSTWDECKRQVTGFSAAEYKGFTSLEEAKAYLGIGQNVPDVDPAEGVMAYVDGSYDVTTGHYSCGAVLIENGEITTLNEKYTDAAGGELRNVAGEIMGAKIAIDYCLKKGSKLLTIYHDYMGVGKWGDDEWKANLPMTQEYKAYVKTAREKLDIRFVKVKGHAGVEYNEMADALAKAALGK